MFPVKANKIRLLKVLVGRYYRPIFLNTLLKAGGEKSYSLSVGFLFQRKELRFQLRS
jgi:hypothetical protein